MKLRLEQLTSHLAKQDILPVYLFSGDVPLLIQDAVDALRLCCKQKGYEERITYSVDKQFDWNQLLEEANALSLFAEKKLIELRFDKAKPGTVGAKALQAYCDRLPEDTILALIMPKFDGSTLKSKWVNTIENIGALMQVWPVERHQLPAWVQNRAQKVGISIDKEAAELLSERVEGNLLAAQQELEKLKLLTEKEKINVDDIEASVADSAKYDIFALTDACLTGNVKQALRILSNLKAEGSEPAVILWAITKDTRILMELVRANLKGGNPQQIFSKNRVIKKRQAGLSRLANQHSITSLTKILQQAKVIDDLIKGIKRDSDPWNELTDMTLAFTRN